MEKSTEYFWGEVPEMAEKTYLFRDAVESASLDMTAQPLLLGNLLGGGNSTTWGTYGDSL